MDLEKAFDQESTCGVCWTSRKQGVEVWLVKTVKSKNRNAQNHITVNGTFSNDFLVR